MPDIVVTRKRDDSQMIVVRRSTNPKTRSSAVLSEGNGRVLSGVKYSPKVGCVPATLLGWQTHLEDAPSLRTRYSAESL